MTGWKIHLPILYAVLLGFGMILAGFSARGVDAQPYSAISPSFERSTITIETGTGPKTLTVEIARTPEQQQHGLMYRKEMAADAGMIFFNAKPRPMNMWMKNTYLPLDMLFFDPEGQITRIVRRAVPLSETIIPSGGPVAGVLELNSGSADKFGIHPGDYIRHPAFTQ